MPVRPRPTAALLAGVLLLAGCGSSTTRSSSSARATTLTATTVTSTQASAALGPEGIPEELGPQLAPASSTAPGTTVDGIQCAPIEQLAYHIHAHLQVYVDGQSRQLPPAIGLIGPISQQTPNGPFFGARTCYYWLHTHAGDGIVHIESPTARIYTLGQFFDEWRQPLSSTQVGSATGPVTAYVNAARWTANPRSIPLDRHAVIQLDVGTPVVAFKSVSFAGTGL
ncbi:MAG: hypothetical protein ABSG43_08160 [Solirubrobacteraceae bacterium]|jgi:hypothetical protein